MTKEDITRTRKEVVELRRQRSDILVLLDKYTQVGRFDTTDNQDYIKARAALTDVDETIDKKERAIRYEEYGY